jgi:AsmA family/AsmA-like C-terminal region
MLSRSTKRVVYSAAILVVVVLFVVPFIRVNNYRESVAASLSQALGRKVTVQSIELKTFPQPGLLLRELAVADDPAISAEPMLRADEVLAILHISSLWRWRLEISSLKLSSPSLNLVRADDGRWNVESLLERARQTTTAPTGQARPERRARFPYIESDAGRINLKLGQEKKVFALGEADFALWLNAEDEWRMRLEARPIRTDANLSNAGTVKVEGSWRRSPTLRETPVSFRLWWEDAQLGQLTSLIYGRDRGWRGSVRGSATVTGKPDDLTMSMDGRVDDFRRYDIATSDSISLHAHCDAKYSLSDRSVRQFSCSAPVEQGTVLAVGTFSLWTKPQLLDIQLTVEDVQIQTLAQLARRMKKDIPQDLRASGTVTASFGVRASESGEYVWTGGGTTTAMQVQSSVLSEPITLDYVELRLVKAANAVSPKTSARRGKTVIPESTLPPNKTVLTWSPVSMSLKGATPVTMNGWISSAGFLVALNGEAELDRIVELGRLFGLPTPATELSGVAKGHARIAGTWEGFQLPDFTGHAQLTSVTAKIAGVSSPLRIPSGQFTVNEYFGIARGVGSFSQARGNLDFSVFWPKQCMLQEPRLPSCEMRIDFTADQLNVDEINSLLNPKAQKRPWYAAIADTVSRTKRQKLPELYASGRINAAKFVMKGVTASHFSSSLKMTPGKVVMSEIAADVLGGRYLGQLTVDTTGSAPAYASKGRFQNVAVANVASLMRDAWASGKLSAAYEGTAKGWSAEEIIASTTGDSSFEWHDGVLHHIDLDSTGKPLQFRLFAGDLELKDGVFSIRRSKLQAPKGIYLVNGTASLARRLQFTLARDGAPGFSISGTLERPIVLAAPARASETQATLR